MIREDEFAPFFQRMLDAPDEMLAEMQHDAGAFERAIVAADADQHQAQAALPDRRAVSFVMFDRGGAVIPDRSADPVLPSFATLDELKEHIDPRSIDGRLICISSPGAAPVFGFWAPFAEAQRWNLPARVRERAKLHEIGTIAVFASGGGQLIESAVAAFRLPPHHQRITAAVVRTGSLRDAAKILGISYPVAREAMSTVAQRMRLNNTPAVVRAIVAAAFGILPGDVESPVQLADTFCISERQARVALLISSGASREATARALGTSAAVIKKELQVLFASLGVQSAAELARLITEAQGLRAIARSIDNPPGFLDPAIEPSRFSNRPNGRGVIAWSDYGPASGRPVLVVHSNWCCRAVPLPLLKELQSRGWRPIAIDRPGFGATSLGCSTREDPFTQAIEDAVQILDELKLASIPIVARCGAQFVHAFAAREPRRIGPVILVSPTPQAKASGGRAGPVGAFKEAFYRSPRLIELFFRVVSAQFTFERVEQLMRSITRGSEVDAKLCHDEQFIRDRFRALRPFACGGYVGGVLEELVISQGGWDFAPIRGSGWIVLQGALDYHHEWDEVESYWRPLLPDAEFAQVRGGGRFLTSSHPHVVVEHLDTATGQDGAIRKGER